MLTVTQKVVEAVRLLRGIEPGSVTPDLLTQIQRLSAKTVFVGIFVRWEDGPRQSASFKVLYFTCENGLSLPMIEGQERFACQEILNKHVGIGWAAYNCIGEKTILTPYGPKHLKFLFASGVDILDYVGRVWGSEEDSNSIILQYGLRLSEIFCLLNSYLEELGKEGSLESSLSTKH